MGCCDHKTATASSDVSRDQCPHTGDHWCELMSRASSLPHDLPNMTNVYLLILSVATNLQVPPPKKKSSIDNDFCIFVIYRKDKKRQNFAWRRSLTAAARDKMGWPLASSDLHCLFSLWFSPRLPWSLVHPQKRKTRDKHGTVLCQKWKMENFKRLPCKSLPDHSTRNQIKVNSFHVGFSNVQIPIFLPEILASVALTVCTVLLRVYFLSTTTAGGKSLRAVCWSVGRLDYRYYNHI